MIYKHDLDILGPAYLQDCKQKMNFLGQAYISKVAALPKYGETD